MKKGSIIFYEGDEPRRLYFILDGFVKLYRASEDGRDTIIYLYGPGSILGVRAFTSQDKILRHSAEAITDVKVSSVSEEEYLQLLKDNPEYIIDLLHVFIDRLNYTERKLEGFILTDSTARVASFLLDLGKRIGKKKNDSVTIPLPLTHQLIAEFVGSFRETVTNALHKLKSDNTITVKSGKIVIVNIKQLQQHASGLNL